MNRFGKLTIVTLLLFGFVPAQAQTLKGLDDRVYKLEKALGGKNPVMPMDARNFRLGGFLTSTYANLQSVEKQEGAFTTNRFELLLGMDINDNLEFFTAFGIISQSVLENGATADRTYSGDKADNRRQNPTPLIISHGTYKWSRFANLKFGRFVAPVGIINIEHFPPGLFLETAPQHLRPIPGGVLWNHFLNGVDFFGTVDMGWVDLFYSANYSTFSFLNGPAPVRGHPSSPITGSRLALGFMDNSVTLGGSYQGGSRDALGDSIRAETSYQNYGADLLVNVGGFNLKTEYSWNFREGASSIVALMVQPSYALTDTLRLVYRWDNYDGDKDTGDDAITEQIIGLNYLPDPLLRLRLEHQLVNYEVATDTAAGGAGKDPDYSQTILSAVLSF